MIGHIDQTGPAANLEQHAFSSNDSLDPMSQVIKIRLSILNLNIDNSSQVAMNRLLPFPRHLTMTFRSTFFAALIGDVGGRSRVGAGKEGRTIFAPSAPPSHPF